MGVVLPLPGVANPVPFSLPCPIQAGYVVPWGWKRLFWRTVEAIGEPLRQSWGWIVPVRYRGYYHGIVVYRFGDAEVLRFDTVADVCPNTWFVRTRLREAISMPRLLPRSEDDVLRVVIEGGTEDRAEPYEDEVEERSAIFILHLHDVFGSRNGRRDFAEIAFGEMVQEGVHIWG